MSSFICEFCNKKFKSKMALQGHSRMHGQSNGSIQNSHCCIIDTQEEIATKNLEQYLKDYDEYISDPNNKCKNCDKIIPYINIWSKQFCNKSCSTSYTNKLRPKKSKTKRLFKIKIKNIKIIPDIVGDYIKIFYCNCKHSGLLFCSRKKQQYHPTYAHLYKSNNRNRYKFTFAISKYPDLFDGEIIKQLGFYAPGGKSGNWNPNGLSRDHKISINEAIKYNYDPYYITHPLNCELMPQIDNNKKKTNSSILYEELVELVDNYELSKSV